MIQVACLLLAGSILGADASSPAWRTDYFAARRECMAANKPMLVVFERDEASLNSVRMVSDRLAQQDRRLLDKYVLVRVDVGTDQGRKLAHGFRVQRVPHVAICNAQMTRVVYSGSGGLSAENMELVLAHYSAPRRAVPVVRQPVYCST